MKAAKIFVQVYFRIFVLSLRAKHLFIGEEVFCQFLQITQTTRTFLEAIKGVKLALW